MLTEVEILTQAEFRERSRCVLAVRYRGRLRAIRRRHLGMIVGTVIVAQTFYSSTKDHLNEFATLRAIGSSGMYIHKVIICQALINAVIGFGIAAASVG